MVRSKILEREGALSAARLMAVSARTAPKTRGVDNIEILILTTARDIRRVAQTMKVISKRESRRGMDRDALCIADSPVIIVIGVKSNPAGLNCGFCGYGVCAELSRTKGVCAYNSIDLGIAVSSAVVMASVFRVDNRIMYSVGRACIEAGLFGRGIKQALGVPLSVTGKNPFFDRG